MASLPSLDQEFLRRVNESILRHLADEAFGVDQPGAAIGTGRTQVHCKLKALTGQSPGEGIRVMRLHRALLRARIGTVAGVACQVGWQPRALFHGLLVAVRLPAQRRGPVCGGGGGVWQWGIAG